MTYRDILVQVDKGAAGRARLAARLADRFKAHLTGAFLKSAFLAQYMAAEALGGLPPTMIDELLTSHAKAVDAASEDARLVFEAAAGEAGCATDWLTLQGDSALDLQDLARRSDLTVMPVSTVAPVGQNRITAAEVALGAAGPVLIVPDEAPSGDLGRNILVGWNGGREAARALRDAMPLLQEAEAVHVLIISPGGMGGPEAQLQRHLEHHGITPNIIRDSSDDQVAADVFREEIKALGADLLVMGLYGRPRLQELVLGGVSHDLLDRPPVPLLVSH